MLSSVYFFTAPFMQLKGRLLNFELFREAVKSDVPTRSSFRVLKTPFLLHENFSEVAS